MKEAGKEINRPKQITSISILLYLLKRPSLTKSAQYRITVAIEGIPHELNKSIELKANQYLQSCGCKEGMVTGIFFIAGSIILKFFCGFSLFSFFLNSTFFFLIGAVLGKLITYGFLYTITLLEIRRANLCLNVSKTQ